MDGFSFHTPMMLLSMLFWLVLLGLLISLLVRVFSQRTTPPGPTYTQMPPNQPSALEILRQRYAHGEIDTATFDQMRERLEATERRQ